MNRNQIKMVFQKISTQSTQINGLLNHEPFSKLATFELNEYENQLIPKLKKAILSLPDEDKYRLLKLVLCMDCWSDGNLYFSNRNAAINTILKQILSKHYDGEPGFTLIWSIVLNIYYLYRHHATSLENINYIDHELLGNTKLYNRQRYINDIIMLTMDPNKRTLHTKHFNVGKLKQVLKPMEVSNLESFYKF